MEFNLRPPYHSPPKETLPQNGFNQTTLNRSALFTSDIKAQAERNPNVSASKQALPQRPSVSHRLGDLLVCRVRGGRITSRELRTGVGERVLDRECFEFISLAQAVWM
jgi:hypothetical protein